MRPEPRVLGGSGPFSRPYSRKCPEEALQHHLALTCSAASILGAFRRILSIFITLSLLNTRTAGSVQRVIPHK